MFKKNLIFSVFMSVIVMTGYTVSMAVEWYDLTHPIPLFETQGGDVTKADLSKPLKGSVPTASFGFQATRLAKPNFKTKVGDFQWGWVYLDEHYGTHIDSTDHYINTAATLDGKADSRSIEEFTIDDLIGPIVFIDISDRVAKELSKNGGKPSPDRSVTNFRNETNNTLKISDIEAVESQITNRSWIVIRTGWDQFFFGTPPEDPFMHPYINGLNYPGLHDAVVDKLIEIEKRKGIKINGIVVDNLSIDSGHSGLGTTGDPFNDGWNAHNKGLQRGWKFVENAAKLGQLANQRSGSCTLIVGAIKLISASGAQARLLARCE